MFDLENSNLFQPIRLRMNYLTTSVDRWSPATQSSSGSSGKSGSKYQSPRCFRDLVNWSTLAWGYFFSRSLSLIPSRSLRLTVCFSALRWKATSTLTGAMRSGMKFHLNNLGHAKVYPGVWWFQRFKTNKLKFHIFATSKLVHAWQCKLPMNKVAIRNMVFMFEVVKTRLHGLNRRASPNRHHAEATAEKGRSCPERIGLQVR